MDRTILDWVVNALETATLFKVVEQQDLFQSLVYVLNIGHLPVFEIRVFFGFVHKQAVGQFIENFHLFF